MTTTYNVNIVGSLTNNNGILSGFSDSNYATCNRNFDPSANSWEIVFKIRRTSNTHANSVFFAKVFDTWSGIRMQLVSTNQCAILGMGDGRSSTTVLSLNTWYWVKLKYNNPTYTLYISTDGTYYTAEATDTLTTTYPSYNNPCTIGKQLDTTNRPWDGEVDLNESYIKVNDLIFWQGVSDTSNVITKIQLRHDTAANWTSVNPVLLEGEVGIETDTKKQKIGDGSTPWNGLQYNLGSTALQRLNADGQPVAKYLLVDNTKTVHSASADLSSYINDSTSASYEVLVEVNIASNNTTNLWVGDVADPYTNKHGNAFCIGTNTTSGSTQAHFSCWIPLATSSRTLYYQLAGSSASSSADVNLLGYRRLGTNT